MGQQRSESMRVRETKIPAGAHARLAPRQTFLRFQQYAGNRGVGRLLALHGIQAKLTVAASGDPYESEADRVADTVIGMSSASVPLASRISRLAALPVQRKCANCEEEEQLRRKPSANGKALGPVLPSLEDSIQSARQDGQPISASMRSYFEPRFGADFSAVRVHTDSSASDLASAVGAHAFTTGQDIFFVSGRYQPASLEGRRLLAHELTHTIQQQGVRAPLVQREEASKEPAPDVELDWTDKILIKTFAAPTYAMGSTIHSMVEATATGFVKQVKAEAKVKGEAFWKKVKDTLTVSGVASFVLLYWWGLVKGIFSPITGLIDLAKLAIQLMGLPQQILATVWKKRQELAEEATQLAQGMSTLSGRASAFLAGLKSHPIDTVKALAGWFSSLEGDAIKGAEKGGRSAGHELMAQLDKPLPKLGEAAGEIVGTVLINIVLLVFTEGIGNAIGQIATKLGELGSFIGKFGKAAEMLAAVVSKVGGFLETIGVWIAKAEAAIAKVAETVLKPIGPVLEEFGKLVSGLRTFLRKLLGVSEEAAVSATEQAVGGVARAVEGKTPPPVPKPAALKPTVKAPVPSGAADEGASVVGAKNAPKTSSEPVTPKVAEPSPTTVAAKPTEAKLFEGVSEDTEALFARRPGLKKTLAEHPDAADLFKLCKSECFPSFMTDEEIGKRLVRLERIQAEAKRAGIPFDRASVKELLHVQKTVEDIDRSLAAMEDRLREHLKDLYSGAPKGAGESPAAPLGQPPKPDVSGNYSFREYSKGGNTYKEARGRLGKAGEVIEHRDPTAQRALSSGTGDDAGHMIGNRFGAPGGPENLSLQNWKANRFGTYKDLENTWAARQKQGLEIDVRVTDVTKPGEQRPFRRNVQWTETSPDGRKTLNELDFVNTETPESRASAISPPSLGNQAGQVIPVDFVNKERL
jgi:hypothetical protein